MRKNILIIALHLGWVRTKSGVKSADLSLHIKQKNL